MVRRQRIEPRPQATPPDRVRGSGRSKERTRHALDPVIDRTDATKVTTRLAGGRLLHPAVGASFRGNGGVILWLAVAVGTEIRQLECRTPCLPFRLTAFPWACHVDRGEEERELLDDTRRGWKKQAIARCHEIVDRTDDHESVTDDDFEFLIWLLDRHPRAAEKIGNGVDRFSVQTIAMGTHTRGFVVHRIDGSSTDFSYYKCVSAPNEAGQVRQAMRRAVADQVIAFKRASVAQGPLVCQVTSEPLTWYTAHVDHAPPVFLTLADRWAASVGGYPAIRLSPAKDGEIGRALEDPEPWQAFHQEHARLRIVSRLANLSLLRRGENVSMGVADTKTTISQ